MIHWFYKNIFRGIGVAILIGTLTILYLKISGAMGHQVRPTTVTPQTTGGKR